MLEQTQGPLELVNLDSGLVVLESARGRTVLRLAVTPGRYLVRRRDPSGIWAREVEVAADSQARLSEDQLQLVRRRSWLPRTPCRASIPRRSCRRTTGRSRSISACATRA